MATKQQVIDIHLKHPAWAAPDIARKLGCMPEYVRATANRNGFKLPRATGEFHARLRNAAPELLAALKALVSDTQDYERVNNLAPSPGRIHCWQSMTNALAAITKAEGRS